MTDSQLGKRDRLIEGARRVLHEQGVEATTLADMAAAADVPVGNVYYYFKTKDELIEAVIDAHAGHIQTVLAELDRHRTPRARLKALAESWIEMAEEVARYSCPHGTLCQELAKRGRRSRPPRRQAHGADHRLGRGAVPPHGHARRPRPRRRTRGRHPGHGAPDHQ